MDQIKTEKHDAITLSSMTEKEVGKSFVQQLINTPIPEDEVLSNLGLYFTSKNLARILFFNEIYKKIIGHHGIAVEFGVRWGQTLSVLSALRGIYEPFNRHRKIVGFDTFNGFEGVCQADGLLSQCKDGSYSVTNGYEQYLDKIMWAQEQMNPMSHVKRYEIVKGDAVKTVPEYFANHTETIVSLAIFDFDIYIPTKAALEAIQPNITKGSILVFDELCEDIFPGETQALKEVFDIRNLRVQRLPFVSRLSFVEIE